MKTTNGFLYKHVTRELRRRIDRGVYGRGDRIPSESALVKELRVSAITIRRAIRDLSFEGLLIRRQGLGVFVAQKPKIVRSLTAMSGADEMSRAGVEPAIKELSLSLVPGTREVARELGLAPAARLYRVEKLILGDGEPMGVDVAYVPEPLGQALREELFHEFLLPLLVSHGITIDHIDFRVEGGILSELQAELLDLSVGFPAVILSYTPIAPDGRAILTGCVTSRADRFSYAFCADPDVHQPKGSDDAPNWREAGTPSGPLDNT
jgi:GntR family transcriptional regulator